MGIVAIVPAWVTPPTGAVEGCHQRAHTLAVDHLAARPVAATLDWVTGSYVSPVSARDLEPTEGAVRAEMMLATAVATGQLGLADDVWALLGVPPAVAVTTDQTWLAEVSATLGWLLGVQARPPLRV